MSTINGYIARDEDGTLRFCYYKPRRENEIEPTWWGSSDADFDIWNETLEEQFKDLTWKDEPVKVTLSINIIPEKEVADKWDGHTPQEAANRLHKYLCEQKFNDKIKPKFKIGDWITFYGDASFKILKIEADDRGILNYLLLSQNGNDSFYDKKYVDENARLWTIQDAKDGDILMADDFILIFKEIKYHRPIDGYCFHCHYNMKSESFKIDKEWFSLAFGTKYQPATKEQRDLLFQKMGEAGYKWNSDKKELIRYEQ